jgi:hypothetical protein
MNQTPIHKSQTAWPNRLELSAFIIILGRSGKIMGGEWPVSDTGTSGILHSKRQPHV